MFTFVRTILRPHGELCLRKQAPGVACMPRSLRGPGGNGVHVLWAMLGLAQTDENTCCSRDWKSGARGLHGFRSAPWFGVLALTL